ncbi:hypothetical protein JW964_09660 [candidate division KSB1 bacterium]|nr:hypothetical protein [candidate division KSB1 bacterium]
MKTSWSKTEGKRTDYIHIQFDMVVVGNHSGTGLSDNPGACSHAEFLAGKYQDDILKHFGQPVLAEVIEAVLQSNENPEFKAKWQRINQIKKLIQEIPIDESLKDLHRHPETMSGSDAYGNRGNYLSYIESDTTSLTYEMSTGTLENKQTGEKIAINFSNNVTYCVELHDYYFFTSNDNFSVMSPQGQIIFSTELPYNKAVFGRELRIQQVFRHQDIIFFLYYSMNSDIFPKGLIRYELDKGLTARVRVQF